MIKKNRVTQALQENSYEGPTMFRFVEPKLLYRCIDKETFEKVKLILSRTACSFEWFYKRQLVNQSITSEDCPLVLLSEKTHVDSLIRPLTILLGFLKEYRSMLLEYTKTLSALELELVELGPDAAVRESIATSSNFKKLTKLLVNFSNKWNDVPLGKKTFIQLLPLIERETKKVTFSARVYKVPCENSHVKLVTEAQLCGLADWLLEQDEELLISDDFCWYGLAKHLNYKPNQDLEELVPSLSTLLDEMTIRKLFLSENHSKLFSLGFDLRGHSLLDIFRLTLP